MDITQANQNFDFPSEWYQALRWGLAAELAPEYGLSDQRTTLVIQRSQMYKDRLAAWDIENASTFLQPDVRMGMPRFV